MPDKPASDISLKNALAMASGLLELASEFSYLEVRIVSSGEPVVQRFLPTPVIRAGSSWLQQLERFDGLGNVYYSVIPRARHSGKADACGPAPAVWADFDDGPPAAIPLPPSLVVKTSPGKFQALWLLDTVCNDLDRIERVNRSIAHNHAGDGNACDRARVLRLPGFRNLKYETRPYARLVVYRPDRRFSIEQLEEAFPPVSQECSVTPTRRGQHRDAPTWLGLVFDAIIDHLSSAGYSPRLSGNGAALALCPLHEDKDPSLSLHPTRGWNCFGGCGGGRLTRLALLLGVRV